MKTIYLHIFIFLFFCPCQSQKSDNYICCFSRSEAKQTSRPIISGENEIPNIDYSIFFDLNDDSIDEMFYTSDAICGRANCEWHIIDTVKNEELGTVDGSVIFIMKKKYNGYHVIECYSDAGQRTGAVTYFRFSKGEYKETIGGFGLNPAEIDQYFKKHKDVLNCK